ncbi:MAG: 16S rRNA (guanine(527)-N(7))-methyltransferase RsmG [Bacilli bacterium]
MNLETFVKETKKLGLNLTEEQLEQLEKFYQMLIYWNEKINLTTITEKEDVYLKHFYDSLTLCKIIDFNKQKFLCDVGTGAGFPGIILKIIFPHLEITLIDSLNKRITFLKNVIQELKMSKIEAIHIRMEDYSKKNIEKFDIITSRAVAKIQVLSEISFQSLKVGGHLILMKSSYVEELENSKEIIPKLNGKINNIITFTLPIENSKRALIDIEKVSSTPKKYPRNIDKIKKSL